MIRNILVTVLRYAERNITSETRERRNLENLEVEGG